MELQRRLGALRNNVQGTVVLRTTQNEGNKVCETETVERWSPPLEQDSTAGERAAHKTSMRGTRADHDQRDDQGE